MMKRTRRVSMVFVALVAPMLVGATASATNVFHQTAKGNQAEAQFSVFDNVTCSDGSTQVMETFMSILTFQNTVHTTGGPNVASVEMDIDVNSFDPCTFVGTFDFGTFQVASLPMTDLNTASLLGHFVLPQGTVVDLNLTLNGTDQIQTGHSSQRSTFARGMLLIRSVGSQREAAISGTATINGRVITSSQMSDADAQLQVTSSGEIEIINP